MPHGYQVTFEYITVLFAATYVATYVHITKHRYRTAGYLYVITDCTFCNYGSFVVQCMSLMRNCNYKTLTFHIVCHSYSLHMQSNLQSNMLETLGKGMPKVKQGCYTFSRNS